MTTLFQGDGTVNKKNGIIEFANKRGKKQNNLVGSYNSKHSSNIGLSVFFFTSVYCSALFGNMDLGRSSTMTKGSLKPVFETSDLFEIVFKKVKNCLSNQVI